MSDLPKDFDVIIVGTGLTESIVAAALARIGKTVLHTDRNEYYGGEFSSLSLNSLIEWAEKVSKVNEIKRDSNLSNNTDNLTELICNNDLSKYYSDIEFEWTNNEESKEKLKKFSRRFCIDLCPNIFYSYGQFTEILASSDVAKYCEFKMVNQILTKRKNSEEIEKVPTSRSEVFKTNQLTMIEKRIMMQFIQSCMKDADGRFRELVGGDSFDLESCAFRTFIEQKKWPPVVRDYLLNAVAMCGEDEKSALQGLKDVKKFIKSVGRFGDSPFLFSLYGAGELPQCFCRLAAVFGAIYYLHLEINKFSIEKTKNLVESINLKVNSEDTVFKCKHLLMDSSYIPETLFINQQEEDKISRCILVTDSSIFKNKSDNKTNDQNISLLFYPKTSENKSNIYCIEASSASNCCPVGYYLVYLFCEKPGSRKTICKEDFEEFIQTFFSRDNEINLDNAQTTENSFVAKPRILFSFFYSHVDSNKKVKRCQNVAENLHVVGASRVELDFDFHVEQAREIFNKICPGEQFLPKPPDQEDIIFGDEETKNDAEKKEDSITVGN